ncbi:hypothetical protein FCH28_37575 [Streptomyces piniterrae]|uniref:Uncharacterized protein n=1 Tax=Streptomyces piniterrae TaxID=2571125 RepID=A0A4U0MKL7_9ACTN|nr:hypothetical protein [Streptomyces piniterrae]TJZ41200.1 hypothetical protein FCH28_37575 [Streptomyces piniterrae]
MFDNPDLKLTGLAYVDGEPVVCGNCDSGFSLQIYKRGFREVWPAWITCLSCGKGDDHQVITNGLVDAALAARTGRQKAEDRDTFTAEWRGIVMAGELVPEFVLDDAVAGAKVLRDEVSKETKAWWQSKKKAAKAQVKAKAGAVTGAAKEKTRDAASTAKAGALTTAWTLQTGGAGPAEAPKAKRRRCTVKGCRGGMVTLSTRLHSSTGKTREVKIPCGVCHRSST